MIRHDNHRMQVIWMDSSPLPYHQCGRSEIWLFFVRFFIAPAALQHLRGGHLHDRKQETPHTAAKARGMGPAKFRSLFVVMQIKKRKSDPQMEQTKGEQDVAHQTCQKDATDASQMMK